MCSRSSSRHVIHNFLVILNLFLMIQTLQASLPEPDCAKNGQTFCEDIDTYPLNNKHLYLNQIALKMGKLFAKISIRIR
ncbi:hypothetical protein QE152_g10344 [Popillia japonica]|uniref:Uncharacterized protein n=1 Tax=Popillia japonica TaxID=7064 RepID=A0AAW1LUV7_POPJA